MPIMKCTKNGRSGWKWGQGGACLVGPDAKARVSRMAYAIGMAKARRRGTKGRKAMKSAERYVSQHESKHE